MKATERIARWYIRASMSKNFFPNNKQKTKHIENKLLHSQMSHDEIGKKKKKNQTVHAICSWLCDVPGEDKKILHACLHLIPMASASRGARKTNHACMLDLILYFLI